MEAGLLAANSALEISHFKTLVTELAKKTVAKK
jgi:hypothetical protein